MRKAYLLMLLFFHLTTLTAKSIPYVGTLGGRKVLLQIDTDCYHYELLIHDWISPDSRIGYTLSIGPLKISHDTLYLNDTLAKVSHIAIKVKNTIRFVYSDYRSLKDVAFYQTENIGNGELMIDYKEYSFEVDVVKNSQEYINAIHALKDSIKLADSLNINYHTSISNEYKGIIFSTELKPGGLCNFKMGNTIIFCGKYLIGEKYIYVFPEYGKTVYVLKKAENNLIIVVCFPILRYHTFLFPEQ